MGLWNSYKKLWTKPLAKLRGDGGTPVHVDASTFPVEIVTAEGPLFGELTVPTQSDGATISQSGWRVGGDTIARTTSSGTVEEDPYEDLITRLRVLEDEIEMGVLLDDGYKAINEAKKGAQPTRTIRISLEDITDVRAGSGGRDPGFTFETAEDVYQIELHNYDGLLSASGDFETEWIDELVDAIEERSARADPDDAAAEAGASG
jgi:hypothetical protein